MRLIRASIENYKSLKQVDITLDKNKTLLIGRNNSGKTSFLRLLSLLFKPGSDSSNIPAFNPVFDEAHMYFDVSKPLRVALLFEIEKLEMCPNDIQDYIETVDAKHFLKIQLVKKINEKGEFTIGPTDVAYPEYVKVARFIYLNCFIVDTERSFKENSLDNYTAVLSHLVRSVVLDSAEELRSSTLQNNQFCDLVANKLSTYFKRNIFLHKIFPDYIDLEFVAKEDFSIHVRSLLRMTNAYNPETIFKAFEIVKGLQLMIDDGKKQSLYLKGKGLQSVFLINLILKTNEYFHNVKPLICIDEVELNLHPQAQRSFNEMIDELSLTNQIILTTHSPIFVTQNKLSSIVVLRKENNCTSVAQLSNFSSTRYFIKHITEKNAEMFFANSVLLVEGLSDYIYINHIASLRNTPFHNYNVSIVDCGSKSTIPLISNLLASLNIPHFCLFDSDATSEASEILANRGIEANEEPDFLKLCNANNIHLLEKGAIEAYYPEGLLNAVSTRSKVNKAIDVCARLNDLQYIDPELDSVIKEVIYISNE